MRKALAFTVIAVFVLLPVGQALALWGFEKSLEGVVKSVREDMVTISGMHREGEASQEVTLEVHPQTKLQEIASLETLKRGDQVIVKYREDGDKKIATLIAKLEAEAQQKDQSGQRQESPRKDLGS